MSASGKNKNVVVAVRVKPESRVVRKCLSVVNQHTLTVGEKVFNYDYVFKEETTQTEIYALCVSRLVDSCFKGYNATIFAYGQTGSGKTHSIVGLARDPEDEGVIPRALRHVYRILEEAKASESVSLVSVHVSFIEIYNEECRDLLHTDIASKDIMIREDKDGRIFFTGAREEAVASVNAALQYLELGNLQRTTGGTFMNAASSRSHAIFTLSLELVEYMSPTFHTEKKSGHDDDGEGDAPPSSAGRYIQSKLHMVDLAGSERAKRTGAEGVRLKESVGINQGLLALGKVIRALTTHVTSEASNSDTRKAQHVPYRESKLTRFLQDSLGGNSLTVMLACVSSADANAHETLSTLTYAARARAVQNRIKANVKAAPIVPTGTSEGSGDVENAVVAALRLQLAQMQEQMLLMRLEKETFESKGTPSELTARSALAQRSQSPRMGFALQNSLLRTSINSLYDSINAGPFQAIGLSAPTEKTMEEKALKKHERETVARILPVIAEVQEGLAESLEDLGEEITSDRHYANGTFWGLICAATASSETLAELLEQTNQLSAEALRLSVSGLPISDDPATSPRAAKHNTYVNMQQKEIERLKTDLQGCYDDLKRDEEIFQEKMRELKKSKKLIKGLEAEKAVLEQETLTQSKQIQQLLEAHSGAASKFGRIDGNSQDKTGAYDVDRKAAVSNALDTTRVTIQGQMFSGQSKDAPDIDYEMYWDPEEDGTSADSKTSQPTHRQRAAEEEAIKAEDADLSRIISTLVPEPDLAQLMEDLESVQSERDALLAANHEVELKYRSAADLASAQREEFEEKQTALKKQLQELEIGIRLKQACISDLVRSEQEAALVAEQHAQQVRTLEQKATQLQKQLQLLQEGQSRGQQEVATERTKRLELERRAAEAEEELEAVRLEARRQEKRVLQDRAAADKKREDLRAAEALSEDLQRLRSEYTKVTSQFEANEATHRKALDRLTSQVTTHRKQAEESESKIKKLEERNAELTARLERSAKSLREREKLPPAPSGNTRPPPPPVSGVAFGSAIPGSATGLETTSAVSMGSGRRSKGSQGSPATSSGRSGRRALSADWLLRRVDELTAARSARAEAKKLSARCAVIDKDRQSLRQELEQLQRQATEAQKGTQPESIRKQRDKYLSQLSDIDARLLRLTTISSQKVHGSKARRESEQVIAELQQARTTVQQKLADVDKRREANSISTANSGENARLQELQDELETLDAEYDLNRVRLEEERRKLSKGAITSDSTLAGQTQAQVSHAEAVLLSEELISKFHVEEDQIQLLVSLARALVDRGHRSTSDAAEILALQCQLDEKESEIEELTESARKARSAHMLKMEQTRREAEDKEGFLLQQLRALESRAVETNAILRQSQDAFGTASSLNVSASGQPVSIPLSSRLQNLHRDSLARESLMSKDSFSENSPQRASASRPRQTTGTSALHSSRETIADDERQRITLLEKRNSELMKELRALRAMQASVENASKQRA